MPIIVKCLTCGEHLLASDSQVGKIVKCPKCSAELAIPTRESISPSHVQTRARAEHESNEYEVYQSTRQGQRQSPRRRDFEEGNAYRLGGYSSSEVSPTSRTIYILLGILIGGLGVHNFVAGRTGEAIGQLAITVVSIPLMCVSIGFLTILIPSIWAVVNVIAVTHDGQGRRML